MASGVELTQRVTPSSGGTSRTQSLGVVGGATQAPTVVAAVAKPTSPKSPDVSVNISAASKALSGVEVRQPDAPTVQSSSSDLIAQKQAEQHVISDLKARDREVRAHEQAHANAGGVHTGSPKYEQVGPDGVSYAIGGSVDVDVSPVQGDPQATIEKMEQVKSAALAPAQPSSQDLKVAAQADQVARQARAELAQEQSEVNGVSSKSFEAPEIELAAPQLLSTPPASPIPEINLPELTAGATEPATDEFNEFELVGLQPNQTPIFGSGGTEEPSEQEVEEEVDEEDAEETFESIKPENKVVQQYLSVYAGIAQISESLVAAQVSSEQELVDLNAFVDLIA